MAGEKSPYDVEVETVAEVSAVTRESVSISYYPEERQVHLMHAACGWGDLQSIAWPVDKTGAIIAALQRIYDASRA